eukprot:scaffold22643_cov22-Prasinocladus_malaysianus.AAC.1
MGLSRSNRSLYKRICEVKYVAYQIYRYKASSLAKVFDVRADWAGPSGKLRVRKAAAALANFGQA